MPLRDIVPFPGATIPLFVGRVKTVQALDQAMQRQRELVIAIRRARTR
jgi:ATP-dependent Lon protease